MQVSWVAGLWATSAAEIACTSWQCAVVAAVYSLVQWLLLYGSFNDVTAWQGRPRDTARWATLYAYIPNYVVCGLGMPAVILVGFFLQVWVGG